jgi:hypothetical protein
MAMGKKRRKKACAYCPAPATTDDHVPPKGLFAKPYPTLITVPSCDGHNSGNSNDDEYFRLALTVRQDIEQQRDAHAAQQAALRALARPQARGLLTSFLGNTRAVELRTPGGLYLGNGGLYTPDIRRVCAVAQRTALGLFYRDVGHRLPDEYEADTCLLPSRLDATGDEAESYEKIVLPLIHSVCDQSPRFVGKPVLTYWRKSTSEDENASVSVLMFYERVTFITTTTPRVVPALNIPLPT